jgi:hypothetical protein
MASDYLHRVRWKAGELFLHGNSQRSLARLIADYLTQEGTDRFEMEAVKDGEEKSSEEKSGFKPAASGNPSGRTKRSQG